MRAPVFLIASIALVALASAEVIDFPFDVAVGEGDLLVSSNNCSATSLACQVTKVAAETNQTATTNMLNIPPRLMWGWGPGLHGYCGETSTQSIGLFFGQYVSQEQVRYTVKGKEVLIDVNLHTALTALQFNIERWDYAQSSPQSTKFIAWIKSNIDKGQPVIAGWFEKQPRGDNSYDHIMPIAGYDADEKGAVTKIWHDDLYLVDRLTETDVPADVTSRSGCTQKTAPVQPYTYCLPASVDYAVAVKGIVDPYGETLRVMLDVGSSSEPDWGAEDGVHDPAVQFSNVKATVVGTVPGVSYALLRFDSAAALPAKGRFLQGSWSKRVDFVGPQGASSKVLAGLDPIMSDGTYFYRCVKI